MKKNIHLFSLVVLLLFINCKKAEDSVHKDKINVVSKTTSIADKIANLMDSNNKDIIVVAHRGDWRNAPENSLQAIRNCIDMGVDMVEIDIMETKDGELVLMHDKTLDRTTTGKGYVKDWTLDSLMTLKLLDGLGIATAHKIPTLKQALDLTKDKILVNLDKSYHIFDKCYAVIIATKTQDQVIIKGTKTKTEVEKEFGKYLDKVLFMPVVRLPNNDAKATVAAYMKTDVPVAIEFVLENDSLRMIEDFKSIRAAGTSIWVNSLWSRLCGGHDDEKAALNIEEYQWYIDHDIDIIQTDRPKLLIEYLRRKGLHN